MVQVEAVAERRVSEAVAAIVDCFRVLYLGFKVRDCR